MCFFKYFKTLFVIAIFFQFLSCENAHRKEIIEIDFSEENPDSTNNRLNDSTAPLSLAISAMISPKVTFHYYEDLISYLSEKLAKPVQVIQRKTYREVNQLLASGKVDMAFICSGAYVAAEGKIPLEILTVPQIHNRLTYNAYVIVHLSSPFQKFRDLRGKSFAFTDLLSNTGYIYPLARVKTLASTPERFFSSTIFTHAHDYAIQAVDRGIVDGASVDGLIFDYFKEVYPEKVKNIRIIEVSEPFGIPPVVVPRALNQETKNKLRNIFLTLHLDSEGQEILKKLRIERFVTPVNTDYTSIRKNFIIANR